MPTGRILRNFNLSVDGVGYAGKVEELTLPKLTVKTEDHRAGGMDMPLEIDMGMEKLECDFTLSEYSTDAIEKFGFRTSGAIPLTFRGAAQDDTGTTVAVTVKVMGFIKEIDMGNWKSGEKATMKMSVACKTYVFMEDQLEVVNIDVENMVRLIGGEDQLQPIRGALGIDG
jgi:P2 family phage contractile tail tube protein